MQLRFCPQVSPPRHHLSLCFCLRHCHHSLFLLSPTPCYCCSAPKFLSAGATIERVIGRMREAGIGDHRVSSPHISRRTRLSTNSRAAGGEEGGALQELTLAEHADDL